MVKLVHGKIAHAELARLAPFFEFLKGRGNFLRIHQVIGAVELIQVDAVNPHAPERCLAGAQDMLTGKIVAVGRLVLRITLFADAALGCDDDVVFPLN